MPDIPVNDPGPIAHVVEGMRVVDSTGEEIGEVAEARIGDPSVVTSRGQDLDEPTGFVESAMSVLQGHDLPGRHDDRLARLGYVRVKMSGLFSGFRFAAGDEVVGVEGDVVRLSVEADHLTH